MRNKCTHTRCTNHTTWQIHADEIRVKMQSVVVWLALTLQVSTRLWLGATVSEHRDEALLTRLMQKVRASARSSAVVLCRWF